MDWVRGETVGRGSFATVNLVIPKSNSNSTPTAVKTSEVSTSSSLKNEKHVLHQLGFCQRIIPCFGDDYTFENGKEYYNLFLEYASAGTLSDQVKLNGGRIPEQHIRHYTRSIVEGLDHIHRNGFVHCDIKLQNILVFNDGDIKIADFGLAKKTGEKQSFECRGTPLFMSPESVNNGEHESPADIWALGCAVVEMVTGKPAWNLEKDSNMWSLRDDDLSQWENKQHHIFNTYHRTRKNPKPVISPSSIIRKPVVKNKKRSYAQFHLEFGQSDFLLHTCSTCGVEFSPGNVDDEKNHTQFHKCYMQGIQFRGWTSERVISSHKDGRIIMVLGTDPSSHKNKAEEVVKMMEIELGSGWIGHQHCKVYLFVSLQRIVGCVVAEPIKEAFRVVSCSVDEHSDSKRKREKKPCPTTLQFGNIVFQREVEKKAVNVNDSEVMDGRAIFCESNPVAAVCGIRAIWVTPSNRRKHIASQLLDTVRKSFCTDLELQRAELAFSAPTSVGKALACNYTGTGSFLVYKSVQSRSRNGCGIEESRVIEAGNQE